MKLFFNERKNVGDYISSVVEAFYDRETQVVCVKCVTECSDSHHWTSSDRARIFKDVIFKDAHAEFLSLETREKAIRWTVQLADEWHNKSEALAAEYAKACKGK